MPRETNRAPAVGFSYRLQLHPWIVERRALFDVLEVTLDHYFWAGPAYRETIETLVEHVPLVAHGIGLSIGTDAPLDMDYLDRVAAAIDRLGMPYYSEHIAFTRVPGRDLANLLPLPRTAAVANQLIERVRVVQARVPVPLLLENITYYFDYPDAEMDDAAFFNRIFRETGAAMLLDVENLHVNAVNHGFDPLAFLDALDAGAVKALHLAGGDTYKGGDWGEPVVEPTLVDTHDRPLRPDTIDLLAEVLARHKPHTVILERDRRLDAASELAEIVADLESIRAAVRSHREGERRVEPASDRPAV